MIIGSTLFMWSLLVHPLRGLTVLLILIEWHSEHVNGMNMSTLHVFFCALVSTITYILSPIWIHCLM